MQPTLFSCFFWGATFIGLLPIHWNIGYSSIETDVLSNRPPLQFIYMRVDLWANHTAYRGAIGNTFRNSLGNWGTPWWRLYEYMGLEWDNNSQRCHFRGLVVPKRKKMKTIFSEKGPACWAPLRINSSFFSYNTRLQNSFGFFWSWSLH